MDDLLEFLLGFVVDGAMDAVDSPRVPLWARIGLGALLLAFLLGISFLVRWGLIVLGVLFLAGTAVLMVHKLRRRKKRE